MNISGSPRAERVHWRDPDSQIAYGFRHGAYLTRLQLRHNADGKRLPQQRREILQSSRPRQRSKWPREGVAVVDRTSRTQEHETHLRSPDCWPLDA